MSTKRGRTEKPDKSKKIKTRAKPSNLGLFVSESAKYKHFMLCEKQTIFGRYVALNEFEHLHLAEILGQIILNILSLSKRKFTPK